MLSRTYTFRYDNLGNVNHSRKKGINVVLPVETSYQEPQTAEDDSGDGEEAIRKEETLAKSTLESFLKEV